MGKYVLAHTFVYIYKYMYMPILYNNPSNNYTFELNGGTLTEWKVYNPKTSIDENILYQGESIKRTGIPILFPFAGQLKNNIFIHTYKIIPQHGFARNSIWKFSKENQINLNNNMLDISTQEAYPYEFNAYITIKSGKNYLDYKLNIKNQGKLDLPIAPGLHPYLKINHEDKKNLNIKELSQFKAKTINWDNFKDALYFDFDKHIATITFTDKTITIEDIDQKFDKLVIWTEPKKDFICIEPFTKIPDAINIDPIIISPHQSWESTIRFTVSYH